VQAAPHRAEARPNVPYPGVNGASR
jgi:hypothetical protein